MISRTSCLPLAQCRQTMNPFVVAAVVRCLHTEHVQDRQGLVLFFLQIKLGSEHVLQMRKVKSPCFSMVNSGFPFICLFVKSSATQGGFSEDALENLVALACVEQ